MILSQESEDDGCRASGKVVHVIEGERAQDEGENHGREEGSIRGYADDERRKLSRAPEAFKDSHVIEGHGGEKNLGCVRVARLRLRSVG